MELSKTNQLTNSTNSLEMASPPVAPPVTNYVTDPEFLMILKVLLRKSQLLNNKDSKAAAIVFDIDGTMVQDGTWDSPIWSVINFCNYCKEIGMTTIIVTARPAWEENITATKKSLQKLGIRCDVFFFRRPDHTNLDEFKTSARHYISTTADYNILMSIGDNVWDIGKYGGTGVLMKTQPYTNAIYYQIH